MKKILIVLALIVVLFASCSRVEPGYTGLKVDLLGSEKGEIKELSNGRYYIGLNERLYTFPTFNQNYVWTRDKNEGSENDESFTFSIEGMTVNVDVGIEYSLEAGKIKDIFVQYRKGVEELTDVTIRNAVRDSFNTNAKNYTMDDLVNGGMAALMDEVQMDVVERFTPIGINIKSISLVNAPRYPNTVVVAIEAKIEATQKAVQIENELRETEAEAKKKVAEAEGAAIAQITRANANAEAMLIEAEAEAKAKRLKSSSYTDAVLQAMWIEKWNGDLPATMLGDTDTVMPVNR
jgi:regulator of protease activity HflC (stomatin/prohibitin superfamily)